MSTPTSTRRQVLKPGPERAQMAAELAAKYKAGASVRALAEETGKSYGFVHAILTVDAQLTLRDRSGRKK